MPEIVLTLAKSQLLISDASAKALWVEYKRFILLNSDDSDLAPPKWIEALWSIHISQSRLYREFLLRCFGLFWLPTVTDHTSHGIKQKKEMYKRAVEGYKAIFGQQPPESIWEPNVIGTIKDREWRSLNMSRFANFSSVVETKFNSNLSYKKTRRQNTAYYNNVTAEEAKKIVA